MIPTRQEVDALIADCDYLVGVYELDSFVRDLASRAAALLIRYRDAPRAVPPSWLVELQCNRQCKGWIAEDVDDLHGWTLDPNKAIRFARKEDADAFRHRFGFTSAAASSTHLSTEHVWLDAAPAEVPQEPTKAMVIAGVIAMRGYVAGDIDHAKAIWRAMYDAAAPAVPRSPTAEVLDTARRIAELKIAETAAPAQDIAQKAFRAILNSSPGSAHRIARQALAAAETAVGPEDARDAARYRFIRASNQRYVASCWFLPVHAQIPSTVAEFDAAIDAALSRQPGGAPKGYPSPAEIAELDSDDEG